MAPAQPNHPQSGSSNRNRKVLVIAVSFVILLLSLIFLGVVVYFRFFRNNDETTETTDVESPITYDLAGSPFPAWPNAVPPPAEQADALKPPDGYGTAGLSLVAGNSSATQVFQWYQDILPAFGYKLTGQVGDNSKLTLITPAGQDVDVDFIELPDGVVGIVAYLRVSSPPPEPPATDVESPITYDLAGFPFPAWPNAVPPPAEQVDTLAPPDGAAGVSLVAGDADIGQVFQWYLDTLPSFGHTLTGKSEDADKLTMTTPAGEPVVIDFTELPEGDVGIVAYIAPVAPPPPATEPETETSAAIEPTPTAAWPDEETAETEPLPPDADAAAIPPADDLGLSVSLSPSYIYAGTLNQLTYTITVTGSGSLTVTVTLPDGVLFHPDDLASAGFIPHAPTPDSIQQLRQVIWKPHFAAGTGSLSAEIDGINDLLHPPDSLVMKVVVESGEPDQQPIVQVAVLDTEKY